MKFGWMVFLMSFVFYPLLYGMQPTALQALTVARSAVKDGELVEVIGERGRPQPQEWVFVFRDSAARGGTVWVGIDRGLVGWRRTPLRGQGEHAERPAIQDWDWGIDSDRAFEIANREAIRRRLSFHWLDYRLEDADGREGVWTLKLFDRMGLFVAEMVISARDGRMMGPVRQAVFEEAVGGDAGSRPRGGLIGEVSELVEDAGRVARDTGRAAWRGILNFVGSAQEILTGERTVGMEEE